MIDPHILQAPLLLLWLFARHARWRDRRSIYQETRDFWKAHEIRMEFVKRGVRPPMPVTYENAHVWLDLRTRPKLP